MCECVCYCAYFYYVIKLYVHVCVLERAKHSFFALPNPLSCSVMNKICLNQMDMMSISTKRNMQVAYFKLHISSKVSYCRFCIILYIYMH